MTLLVDTSVWSLAFRRDRETDVPHVKVLHAALAGGGSIVATGLLLQELLQGFAGPRARKDPNRIQAPARLIRLLPDPVPEASPQGKSAA